MMTENDLKAMGLVLSLDECIRLTRGICGSGRDKLKYARTNALKKKHTRTIEFSEAVLYHLKRLKKIESEIKN